MRELFLEEGSLSLHERPVPIPRPGECLIRVDAAGICGTDLELLRGYADFTGVPGHEFVGTVTAVGEGAEEWRGRRVVGEINIACGRCDWCAQGVREHCEDRSVVGIRHHAGAFAEYLTLPASNLHAVPDTIADEVAVFVEPVAAACRILEQTPIDEATRVAVVGDGRLGLIAALVLRTTGASPVVFGRHAAKLAVAAQLGLEHNDPKGSYHTDGGLQRSWDERHSWDDPSGSSPRSSHRSFDVVVDATGRASGFETALALVRPRGTVVLKSTFHGELHVATWPIVVDEVTIVGSRCGPFARALALLASGEVDVRPLVSARFPLSEFDAAFTEARRSLKVLLRPQQTESVQRNV